MAGDWLKWCKGLTKKREVITIASRIGKSRREVASACMELWEWCDENVTDEDFDEEENASIAIGEDAFAFVDSLLGLPGFAEAMASPEVRWLSARSGGRLVFPNLGRHNGRSAKDRALDRSRKKKKTISGSEPDQVSLFSISSFNLFWNTYPKKGRKEKENTITEYKRALARLNALPFEEWSGVASEVLKEALQTTHTQLGPQDALQKAVERFAASDRGKTKWCWDAKRWLSQGHYEDDEESWRERSDMFVSPAVSKMDATHAAIEANSRRAKEQAADMLRERQQPQHPLLE